MSDFTSEQVSAITFFTVGVFNNDRHHDIMESLGCGQDGLAKTLQPYGAILADESEPYSEGVYVYDICEKEAAQLFINLTLDSGLPDLAHWKEHIQGMVNEVENHRAMIP